jgi:lysophospholipase L1-like esterase
MKQSSKILFIFMNVFILCFSSCNSLGQDHSDAALIDTVDTQKNTVTKFESKNLNVLSAYTDTSRINRFLPEIEKFISEDSLNGHKKADLIFTGSSSIRLWKNLQHDFPAFKLLNRGFGGSTIPEVIYFSDVLLFKHQPGKVVFYAGENDLANDGSDTLKVYESFLYFFGLFERNNPGAHLYFVSLKPSPARMDYWPKMKSLNRMIKDFCHTKENCTFIDISQEMFNKKNELRSELYLKDGVHLNDAGYQIWKKKITSHFNSTLVN